MKGRKEGVFSEFLRSPSLGSGSVKGGQFSVTIGGQFSMTFDTRRQTLIEANENTKKVSVAIARELLGFIWDIVNHEM